MIDTQNVRNTFECFQKSSFENRELIIENLCEKNCRIKTDYRLIQRANSLEAYELKGGAK